MAYFRNTVVGLTFVILFSALVTMIPSAFYTPQSVDTWDIPNELKYVDIIVGNSTLINNTIAPKILGGYEYDFKSQNVLYHNHIVTWDEHFSDEIAIYRKDAWYDVFQDKYEPTMNREFLKSAWDSDKNQSIVQLSDGKGVIFVIFEGTPPNGENITDAWDTDSIFCTLSYVPSQVGAEQVGGYQLIMAMIKFRLPDIYENINPMLGVVISLMFYIPLVMIVFTTGVKVLHG